MSTYTKKTVIVWDKATYSSMLGDQAPSEANLEFHAKRLEMVAAGKMADEGGVTISNTQVTSTKQFINEESAQEWINFNDVHASKYNFTKISSQIISI